MLEVQTLLLTEFIMDSVCLVLGKVMFGKDIYQCD